MEYESLSTFCYLENIYNNLIFREKYDMLKYLDACRVGVDKFFIISNIKVAKEIVVYFLMFLMLVVNFTYLDSRY